MTPLVVIAGGGIGGLTTAIALSQAGLRVAIYEKAGAIEAFGAGLQLTPNATRVLAKLGALERLAPFASKPQAVVVMRGSDSSELMRMPLDSAERRWGAPYLVIHRADLQRVLLEVVRTDGNVDLALGATVVDFAEDGERVAVAVARGGTATSDAADLLIGADGLRSRIRDRLGFGAQDRPEFASRIAWRAVIDADCAPAKNRQDIVLRLGRNAHLVQYPVRGGSVINLVATVRSALPTGGDAWASSVTLEGAFCQWSREARALVQTPAEWRAWPLYCRPPISSFSAGRVALIGDAAHPMVPFLAQGAAQAIEDADELARVLAKAWDIPAALSAYSRGRVGRASRVQREALKVGRIYHMSGPLAFARDTAMRLLGPRGLVERYDWLYGA